MTCDRFEHQGSIHHTSCHGADRIEGGHQRDQPVTGDAPIGGLESGHAAKRGGMPDRAARVLAQGERRQSRRHSRRRPATRSTGDVLEIPGIAGGEKPGILGGGAHAKFVHIGFSQQDCPGRL